MKVIYGVEVPDWFQEGMEPRLLPKPKEIDKIQVFSFNVKDDEDISLEQVINRIKVCEDKVDLNLVNVFIDHDYDEGGNQTYLKFTLFREQPNPDYAEKRKAYETRVYEREIWQKLTSQIKTNKRISKGKKSKEESLIDGLMALDLETRKRIIQEVSNGVK